MAVKKRLGDILIECGMLNDEQLQQALDYGKENGLRVGESLQALGIVSEADIQWSIGDQLGISQVHLKPEMVGDKAKTLVSPEFMKEKGILPLMVMGSTISVVMPDPLDDWARQDFIKESGCSEVSVSICTRDDFDHVISVLFEGGSGDRESTKNRETSEVQSPGKEKSYEARLFNFILKELLVNGAVSAMLQPVGDKWKLVFRQSGSLCEKAEIDRSTYENLEKMFQSRIDIVLPQQPPVPESGMNGSASADGSNQKLNLPNFHGDFLIKAGEKRVAFSISFFTAHNGRGFVLKHGVASEKLTLSELNIEDSLMVSLGECLAREKGLILFGGNLGGGADLLAYSMLGDLGSLGRRVISFERSPMMNIREWVQLPSHGCDPSLRQMVALDGDVYYFDSLAADGHHQTGLSQMFHLASCNAMILAQSNLKNGYSFIHALKDSIRVCDYERLHDLNAFITVQQVSRLCSSCKKEDMDDKERAIKILSDATSDIDPVKISFYSSSGCEKCSQTGFESKMFLLEVVRLKYERLIGFFDGKISSHELLESDGLKLQGCRLLKEGVISLREYLLF